MLVGGWPGSGKSTLGRALAAELTLAYLAKDEVKEALFAALGEPGSVEESQRWGRAAVHVVLSIARRCPGAVIDSTWFEYSRALVEQLPGPVVEVRTVVLLEVVRERYRRRAVGRASGHLDLQRDEDELWARPVEPLGVGPLVEVDTSGEVDVADVAERVRRAAESVVAQSSDGGVQ